MRVRFSTTWTRPLMTLVLRFYFHAFTFIFFFFFTDPAPTEIYTLSLHDALPIYGLIGIRATARQMTGPGFNERAMLAIKLPPDRKSTRLNSSHTVISYAVFCLKKKKKKKKYEQAEARKSIPQRCTKMTKTDNVCT